MSPAYLIYVVVIQVRCKVSEPTHCARCAILDRFAILLVPLYVICIQEPSEF